jgi:HlyD family secretion protein
MKKIAIGVAVLVAIAGAASFFLLRKGPETTYRTVKLDRGPIVSSISATGTLNAVVTVQVGTQVSGTIQKLFVDFNSPVKQGQMIAQIDPSLFGAQLEQTRGNYMAADANAAKAKVTADDAKRTMERNRQLLKDGIISQGDFDAAETAYHSALAALKNAQGTVAQTRGSLRQSETNLRYATIRSPVDGIVVSRNVDVGQTVAASFQTPTLFTIAKDLTKMEIDASIDEADIGRTQVGQPVTFTVDAYPERQFKGVVSQIRNAPVVTQNVVTYVTVIKVDNQDLKLKPGMTANVAIETARKDDVVRIPAAALRFKPKSAGKEGKEGGGRPQQPGDAKRAPREKGGEKVFVPGAENKPKPVPVKIGVSNDAYTELVEGGLKENDEVIVEQINPQKKKSSGGMGGPMGPRF